MTTRLLALVQVIGLVAGGQQGTRLAAREAAPQARQIADRFHLVRNLADVLEQVLARCRAEIRQRQQERFQSSQLHPPVPCLTRRPGSSSLHNRWNANTKPMIARERSDFGTLWSCAPRVSSSLRLPSVMAWEKGVSENRVKQGGPPLHRRPNRRSLFDPYAAYVLSRWLAGVHDGKPLFEEIQARGFNGPARLVRRFLQTLREKRRPLTDLTPT